MFDTVNLWEAKNYLASLPQYLANVSEHKTDTGDFYLSGSLKNYKVNLNKEGVNLKGSLPKFYLNDNIKTLTRGDTERAFENMEDLLHVKLTNSKVYRFDIGVNLLTEKEPEHYFKFLGESKYYNRLLQPKSLYYVNSNRTKAFYNKIAEVKAKAGHIETAIKYRNLLRYELRFTRRLTRQLKTLEVNPALLTNEDFYIKIIDRFYNEFQGIHKIFKLKMNLKKIGRQPKENDFFNQLLILLINGVGQDTVLEMVEDMKKDNVYKSPVNYSRIKAKIKKLSKLPDLTEPPAEVEELEKKLKRALKYYR
jgi:hypothetical protein